ncbi:MAG: hypothetical protein KAT28_01115 [Candidatus Aenigmarchaeota archaeon]|nr:hypothetical protein [Candidatus Aenigmarchaeota archaeon]
MEETILRLKTDIANNFWKNKFKDIGHVINPRKIKNKNLKVLTLTNSRNMDEIRILNEECISSKIHILAWCKNSIEALSLDAEGKVNEVIDEIEFEETILNCGQHKIFDRLPFHILNIDFSSQEIEILNGRIEKELKSIEKIFSEQKRFGNSSFIVMYTTLLEQTAVNTTTIKNNSDQFLVSSWHGLNLSKSNNINSIADKILTLKEFFQQLAQKYNVNAEIEDHILTIDSNNSLCSVSFFINGDNNG